jgi:hypothetical protein
VNAALETMGWLSTRMNPACVMAQVAQPLTTLRMSQPTIVSWRW